MENSIESRKIHMQKPSHGHEVIIYGNKIFYVEEGSGPVILYIHGNLACYKWFSHVMTLKGYRTIALDMPNFGFSDHINSSEIDLYSGYIGAFIDQLNLGKSILVGHSLGGVVAQSLAVKRPELIGALILVDSGSVKGLKTPEKAYEAFEKYKVDYEFLKKAMCSIMPEQKDEHRITELVDMALFMNHESYEGHGRTLAHFDISDKVVKGLFQVLVIRGEKDLLISKEMAEETSKAWGGELYTFENTGHSPQVEDPAQFIKVLLEHVKRWQLR